MGKKGAFYTGEYRNVFAEYGYDPAEIDIIKTYNRRADERFKSGLDKRLFDK